MLLFQAGVPVYLPIVQPETRLVLLHLSLQTRLASQDLHVKDPVLILNAAHLQAMTRSLRVHITQQAILTL